MDVGHPIRSIVATLDGPVLEVLAGTTRPLSGREVHRLSGTGSASGVRLVLARLVEQGVVVAEERSPAMFYSANRNHLAWPAVEILTSMRTTLLESLRTELQEWQIKPVQASLFGSAARGDGGADSDIDVLLVRPDQLDEDQPPWADQVDQLRDRIQAWTGNRCQAFQLDRARLADHLRADDPLIHQLRRDAIRLSGPDLQVLLRELPTGRVDR